MRILLIPDKFKDSLTAQEVIRAIKKGLYRLNTAFSTLDIIASDGGDGFLDAILFNNHNVQEEKILSVDPLGREITCRYLLDKNKQTAYIELANSSGLALLKTHERRVVKTSTLGTGIQLKDAIDKGATDFYIGLGGSATNDAAMGLASVLGYRFLDKNSTVLKPVGENLIHVHQIVDERVEPMKSMNFFAINDVNNPLFGKNGAAMVYGKQKGATNDELQLLDDGLKNLHHVVKDQIGVHAAYAPGAGAAGGTGYGLKAFFGADFISGIDFILNRNQILSTFDKGEIDLVITGEGKIDDQTKNGKFIMGITALAARYKVPVVAICGKKEVSDADKEMLLLKDIVEISDPTQTLQYNLENAAEMISEAIFNYFKKQW